jgi:predicted permease
MSLWTRLANVLRPSRVDHDLDAELSFHLEQRIEELTAAGVGRDEAVRQATRRFGNPQRWREQSRDLKLMPWLDSLLRDLRMGARTLSRNAGVTTAAVASLGLALGACIAAFSLLDALIFRTLPVRQPERLVYLASPTDNPDRPVADTFNDPLFVRLRDAGRGLVDLFGMSAQVLRPVIHADAGGERERVVTQYVSGDAFSQLGIVPAAGRLIAPADDTAPGASPVAVVSHAYWQRRFGGDPAVVGRWFGLDEDRTREPTQFQIVGIAEAGFTGVEPGRPTDVWFPYTMYTRRAFGNYDFGWFRILGRLRDGVAVERAQSVLQAVFTTVRVERASRRDPNATQASIARYLATPLHLHSAANGPSPLRREVARSLWILAAIAGLVLLIAGSNVANLFLARTAARERELSLRLSIGASRGRLIQQVLVESALVAVLACGLGLLFASTAGPAVVSMLSPADEPVRLDLRFDWRVLAFAAAATLVTTTLFGLVPALRASGVAPITALKLGSRGAARAGVMRPFIAAQVGFGLLVLFVGGLLLSSFARLSSVNPGFSAANVMLLSVETTRRVEAAVQRGAVLDALGRLRQVPGVESVTSADFGALGRAWTHGFRVPGTSDGAFEATVYPIAPRYFETMGIPLAAGRDLTEQDMAETARAIVVNESFVAHFYGDRGGLGRMLDTSFRNDDGGGPYEIVGIAADTRYDLRKPVAPAVYIPLTPRGGGTIVARVAGDPAAMGVVLRQSVRDASPLLRVTTVRTQSAAVAQTLLRERFLATLAGFFAAVGLMLAAVGLYGVLIYSVVQRTREIGIRMALGSRQLEVIRTVVADTAGAAAIGAGVGLAGGLYASRYLTSLLFEVQPSDFWSIAMPIVVLLAAACIAAVAPAVRAARVDPVVALRYE